MHPSYGGWGPGIVPQQLRPAWGAGVFGGTSVLPVTPVTPVVGTALPAASVVPDARSASYSWEVARPGSYVTPTGRRNTGLYQDSSRLFRNFW